MSSAPKLIRILAVDDHPLLRKGIAGSETKTDLLGEMKLPL